MTTISCLAFSPHPDDAELSCGGLLAKLSSLGHSTAIVDMTAGEMASRGTVAVRAEEASEASRVLGLTARENLSLPDCGLSRVPPEAIASIVRSIRRHRPEMVLIPEADGRHPDHNAAPRLIEEALFLAALVRYSESAEAPHSVSTVLYYQMRRTITPTFIVDVSDVYAKKMEAIRCHRSQVLPDPSLPQTLVSSPLNLAAIEARDRATGAKIGVEYGEAYRSRTALGIADPVTFFRANSTKGALFF